MAKAIDGGEVTLFTSCSVSHRSLRVDPNDLGKRGFEEGGKAEILLSQDVD